MCGACTLRVNGDIVRGCLMLAVQAERLPRGHHRRASDSKELEKLQKAFHEKNALQCGFCTPGMLMAAQDLVRQNKKPTREEIRAHISGNYCRCTGYQAIVDAIEEVDHMGKAELPLHAPGTQVDKGYIGQSVPRPNAARLLQGRGAFTDDLRFPRLAHVAFFRSPYAHARIKKLDFERREDSPA